MNRDAVIAESNGSHDRLTRQRTTATTQAIIQSFNAQDGPRSSALRRGRILGCHQSPSHLFIAEGRLLLLGLQPDLLSEAVENLQQSKG